MNALRCSLKQLLTAHRDRKFVVPNYQREYEWETATQIAGELHLPGIGKLKVQVKVLSGRGLRLVCEPPP